MANAKMIYGKNTVTLFKPLKFTGMVISMVLRNEVNKNSKTFFPFGKIKSNVLKEELNHYDFTFPRELKNLWATLGGGELFQDEIILNTVVSDKNKFDIIYYNNEFANWGIAPDYFIFSDSGSDFTAFHKQNHSITVFSTNNMKSSIRQQFNNMIDWFEFIWWQNSTTLVLEK